MSSPHSHPSPIYAAIVPVAATDEDWNRLPDLVDSLSTYGPSVEEIVVLDDGAGQARPLPAAPGDCKITRLPNIRAGRGDGWSGGLCAGLIEGYRYLHDNPSPSRKFILRIDTDALAIAPFAGRIAQVFQNHHDVAMIGSYLLSPNNKPRGFEYWGKLLEDMLNPWLRGERRRRTGRRWPTNLWGDPAKMRRMIRKAMRNGYVLGQSVQGGAYAISSEGLDALGRAGYLRNPLMWLNTAMVEDVLVSTMIMATGSKLLGYAANGEVFGVLHKGLPDFPEKLLERGYGIAHSLRNDPRHSEPELRAFFKGRRDTERSENEGLA